MKDRKFYRIGVARRESKWPRNLTAMPDTREVRFWPKADPNFTQYLVL